MSGRCFGVGVGPGDRELITLKAARVISQASVIAYFSGPKKKSHAREIADDHIASGHAELHFIYPLTTELPPKTQSYDEVMSSFYDAAADQLADVLNATKEVAVLCEGDPFFHGSFMYLYHRLSSRFDVTVISGVPSMLAAAAALGTPLVCQDESFCVLTSTMDDASLVHQLEACQTAVILKVGRHLERLRLLIDKVGLVDRAYFVSRVGWSDERFVPLLDADALDAPYFSMIVIPSKKVSTR
jgi:precorrin-2/cobalt-factor-2 C20-methyltransferase